MTFALSFLLPAAAIGICLGFLAQSEPARAVRHGFRVMGALLGVWALVSLLMALAQAV